MDGGTDRPTDRQMTHRDLLLLKTRQHSTTMGPFQLKGKVLASLARLLELGGVSLARHQLPCEKLAAALREGNRRLLQ